jgi:hypothetical protein
MTSSTENPASKAPKKSDKKSDVYTYKPETATNAIVPAHDTTRQRKEGSANPVSTFAAGVC